MWENCVFDFQRKGLIHVNTRVGDLSTNIRIAMSKWVFFFKIVTLRRWTSKSIASSLCLILMHTSNATFLARLRSEIRCFVSMVSLSSSWTWLSFVLTCPQYLPPSLALHSAQAMFAEWNWTKTHSPGQRGHFRVEAGPESSHPSRSLA